MKHSKPFRNKILLIFMVGYSLIIGLLFCYAFYLNYSYSQSLVQTGNATLNLYVSELDGLLKRNNIYLYETISQNFNAIILQSSNKAVKKYSAVYDLKQALDHQLTLEKGIAGFMIFYDNGAACHYAFQKDVTFDDKLVIKDFIRNGAGQEGFLKKWKVVRCEGKSYLEQTYGVSNTYMSIIIDFETMTSDIVNKYEASTTRIVFYDDMGVLNNQSLAEEAKINVQEKYQSSITYAKGYLIFSKAINDTNLVLNVIVPNNNIITRQKALILIVFILLAAFACVLVSYFYLHKKLIYPIIQMTGTMNKIIAGQDDAKMPVNSGIVEYDQTGSTFNAMINQIKELRIKTYEEQIKEQKARLQYLQLQIKPHFYLNCLKNFYALTKQKKLMELDNAIIETSQYLRYTFRDTFKPVMVSDELEFTRDYMRLRENIAGPETICEYYVDESIMNEDILPLTVQTFVENSLKYASSEQKLIIKIQIKRLIGEEMDYLDIIVSDNGQGYAKEWLDKMNKTDYEEQDGEHIGILNLKRRIWLQYGKAAEFAVRNSHGAISEVVLPLKR